MKKVMPNAKTLTAGVIVVSLGVLAPVAGHAADPPPTPDLSQMVLQPSDFASTVVTSEGYQTGGDYVASYQREFGPSTRPGATYLDVMSEVDLQTDAATATGNFVVLEALLHSGKVRTMILAELGKQHIRKKNVRIAKVQELAVGDGAAVLPMKIRVLGVWIAVDLVFVHRDRVDGTLLLLGRGIKVAEVNALTAAMVAHIDAGLAPASG